MPGSLTLSVPNSLSALPYLADTVNAFLRDQHVSCEAIDIVHLALDELVANVIRWGFDDGQAHVVRVTSSVDATWVRIVIEDDGRPFDPRSIPPPDLLCAPQLRHEGGLGVYLVRTMVDEMTYERVSGRNVVEVRVARTPAETGTTHPSHASSAAFSSRDLLDRQGVPND
jgi:serine/threonine-protein kinase RsbW